MNLLEIKELHNRNQRNRQTNMYSSYRPTAYPQQRRRRRPRLFTKDIETLLYALGDGPYSLDSTVNCLEDCLVEYLTDIAHEAGQFARSQGRTRIKIDDLPFAFRNDPKSLGRMNDIKESIAKIQRARDILDYDKHMTNPNEYLDDEDDEGKKPKKEKKRGRKRKIQPTVSFNDSNDSE